MTPRSRSKGDVWIELMMMMNALDNVDSLISKIKGNKKNEEAQKPKETADFPKSPSAGDRSASHIGDFAALRKKMEASNKEEPAPSVSKPSDPVRTIASIPDHDDLEFSDADNGNQKNQRRSCDRDN